MIALSWYLLKVIICSGILCGYYFLALRNKAFHRWNRFYILAAIVISLLSPIIKINFFQNDADKGTVVQMLQTISYSDEAVVEYSKNSGFQLTTQNIAEGAYLIISAIFLFIFFVSIFKIVRLKKKYPETKIEDISFINTNAKGTPFSFFKSIFWNNAIDLHSKSGQQIFNHEIAHVKEKHSYDKIFMNLVLIFFWINPFFWLMRKELYMIHEFIADKEALEDNDLNAFAEMILQTVYPGQNFSSANNFFYPSLKRRILMLTKNKNPKVNYLSRLLVLPLAAIVFFAFTLKVKNDKSSSFYDGKTITVVIDAGHGGLDNGAIFNGIKEKEINLSIAKKIAALNSNKNIKIVLTRNDDQTIPVKDRVVFAENNKADLFISIHVNSSTNEQLNGFSVLIVKNHNEQDQLLGSTLINEFKKSYKTEDEIGERSNGVWVLDHNVCPSALVQCGFLSNPMDAAFISNRANQEKVAENILDAINVYASSENNNNDKKITTINDTIPTKDSIPFPIYYKGKRLKFTQYVDNGTKVEATYYDSSKETITQSEAEKRGFIPPPPPPPPVTYKNGDFTASADTIYIGNSSSKRIDGKTKANGNAIFIGSKIPDDTLIFVDGKEIARDKIKDIPAVNIKSITILDGENAIKKYGEKGKKGVIEITTKNKSGNVTFVTTDAKRIYGTGSSGKNDTIPNKVFTKMDVEATFPGGAEEWRNYITKEIQASIKLFTQADYGTCVVKFIVDKNGSVSDVKATTMKGTHLARISINAIKKGPKWIPATQNGHTVTAYRLQPVTLQDPENNQKTIKFRPPKIVRDSGNVYVNPDGLARFPGGQSAWLKYISQLINKHGNELIADKNNIETCKVKFVVNTNGKVSEVHAITMEGTELARVAVNAIKDGPNWIPGKQNGHAVNSFLIQPVRFALSDKLIVKEPE